MAEAIVAMFVLLGGFTVIFRLFHTAIHYSGIIDAQQNKVRVALNKLEEVRAWSRSVHTPVGSTPFDPISAGWSSWHNKSGVDDDYPEICWKVIVEDYVLYSPCWQFESIKSSDQRKMERCCKQVTVKVNTTDPEAIGTGMMNRPVVITTLIGQPSIETTNLTVSVTGSPATVVQGGKTPTYYAVLRANGHEILDPFFRWATLGDATGTCLESATGGNMTVEHKIAVPNGNPSVIYSVPGDCVPRATCKFRGSTVTGDGPTISIQDS
ncbi:MAG: hypothetical protein KF760_14250 [Candidatus Eremiobacteraeota bacterium]|nr:hypothetical protein [Candidatus Eremiobacteraeota bacterium]MCW5871142.1 hypothetical protein [Candidatus Eremiobacteraeota bacterium]